MSAAKSNFRGYICRPQKRGALAAQREMQMIEISWCNLVLEDVVFQGSLLGYDVHVFLGATW